MPVPSTERLNLSTALKDLFTTTTPFSPITTTAIPLTLVSGTSQTSFDVIAIGSSAIQVEPAFFSSPLYTNEVAGWRKEVQTLNLRSALGDVFFGLILNMVGVTSLSSFPAPTLDAAIASLESIGQTAWTQAIADAASGANFYSPMSYAYDLLKGLSIPADGAVWLSDVYIAYNYLVATGNAAASAAISASRFSTIVSLGFRVVIGAISGASLVLGVGDLAAVGKDLASANMGELWNAVLTIPPIHLTPTSASVVPGSSSPTQFTVSLPTGASGTFVWTWTLTGGVSAQITDESGHQGTTLTDIDAKSVFLLTTPNDINTMTLTVQGFQKNSDGTLTSVGKTSAMVTSSGSGGGVTGLVATNFKIITDPASQSTGNAFEFFTFTPPTDVSVYRMVIVDATGTVVNENNLLTVGDLLAGTTGIYNTAESYEDNVATAAYGMTHGSTGGAFNMGGGVVGFEWGNASWGPSGDQKTAAEAIVVAQAFHDAITNVGHIFKVYLDPPAGV